MGSITPTATHQPISPAIFYWGTPVVIISTTNPDNTTNIAPMSSAWWLGNHCMLGLAANSQTTVNLRRTKQCVLNLASDDMGHFVNALARTTGSEGLDTAPGDKRYAFKRANGYQYVHDKFGHSGLTSVSSDTVVPGRVAECPVQMEAELVAVHEMMADTEKKGAVLALEVKVVKTHVHEGIRMEGFENRIDPDKWRPMIMSFQELYGLAPRKLAESVLGKIPEDAYRRLSDKAESSSKVGSAIISDDR
jgi:flavin reductase (DIM6/NTAB) family NADH-FMN oxidoreductase RutF